MQIQGASSSPFAGLFSKLVLKPKGLPLPQQAQVDQRVKLAQLAGILDKLRGGLQNLRRSTRFVTAGQGLAAFDVQSGSKLGLDFSITSATLASSDEINAVPTSYGPFEPTILGLSTSQPLLQGVYDGSLGDQILTFEIKDDAAVGLKDFDVEVRDENDDKIETLKFEKGQPQVAQTKFGLSLTFTSGLVLKDDTFQLTVSASVGSVVDPDNPFDGTGNASPNFDPGQAVVAGAFEINGVGIAVAADDSIQSVLARINASSAGVTAVFDPLTERIRLTSQVPGSAGKIVLGNDSSGFLNATKLASASLVPGKDPDHLRPIASVPALSGIQSGSFSVNGVSLSVDVATDSLQDVLDRITAGVPGVSAKVDQADDVVEIRSNGPLTLDDGTSGLFTALGIQAGSYEGQASASTRTTRTNESKLYAGLRELGDALESLFSAKLHPSSAAIGGLARTELRQAIAKAVEGLVDDPQADLLRSGFGIDFDFAAPDEGVLRVDARRVGRALQNHAEDLVGFLAARKSQQGHSGLLERLDQALLVVQKSLDAKLGPGDGTGGKLDLFA